MEHTKYKQDIFNLIKRHTTMTQFCQTEEMSHRIPPNIDPLKKYAIYIELIQKSQDSEILTKHFNFNHGDKYWRRLPDLSVRLPPPLSL